MAAAITLTDGTTTISLLSGGYNLKLDGWKQQEPKQKQIRRTSAYGEGTGLIASFPDNVIETMQVDLTGTSHNNFSSIIQTLNLAQRKARQFHTTNWQTTPFYLQVTTKNESNIRYALVYDIQIDMGYSFDEMIFDNANRMRQITILIERESHWRSHIPRTLPASAITISAPQAPAAQVDATAQYFVNARDYGTLTNIHLYAGATVSTTNQINNAAFTYGSSGVVFGAASAPIKALVVDVGTTNQSSDFVYLAASSASEVSTYADTPIACPFGNAGVRMFVTNEIQDANIYGNSSNLGACWMQNSVGGSQGWWARTGTTGSPTNTAQRVYAPADCYVSYTASALVGDVEALALIRFSKPVYTNAIGVRWAAMGVKSRGLTNFTSRFNAAGQNPSGWVLVTGNTACADSQAPTGSRLTSMGTMTVSCETASIISDFVGEYNMYARVRQTTVGSATAYGTITVATCAGAISQNTPTIPILNLSSSVGGAGKWQLELLNLGRVSILPVAPTASETFSGSLIISLTANAGGATINFYDIALIPTDEYSEIVTYTGLPNQVINGKGTGFDSDAGLIRQATTQRVPDSASNDNGGIATMWETRGSLPRLQPDQAAQLHFILADKQQAGACALIAPNFLSGYVKIYAHNRWVFLRGNE